MDFDTGDEGREKSKSRHKHVEHVLSARLSGVLGSNQIIRG